MQINFDPNLKYSRGDVEKMFQIDHEHEPDYKNIQRMFKVLAKLYDGNLIPKDFDKVLLRFKNNITSSFSAAVKSLIIEQESFSKVYTLAVNTPGLQIEGLQNDSKNLLVRIPLGEDKEILLGRIDNVDFNIVDKNDPTNALGISYGISLLDKGNPVVGICVTWEEENELNIINTTVNGKSMSYTEVKL